MANPSVIAKAIVAAILAGAGEVNLALADNVISNAEWIKVIAAVITVFGLVWAVPNAAPTPVSIPVVPIVPVSDSPTLAKG